MRYCVRTSGDSGLRLGNVKTADNFISRFLGLMGRRQIGVDEGLLLRGVTCIHTCFMRFTICVVYLDRELRVLDREVVKPWRCGKFCKRTAHVLEIHPEQLCNIKVDEQLILVQRTRNLEDKGRGI